MANRLPALTLAALIALGPAASAQAPPVSTYPGPLSSKGYQQITSLAAATALTVPAKAVIAVIEVDSGGTSIRWRDDGTNPTAAIGMEVLPGAQFAISGTLTKFKAIQTSATAKLNITYYGQ